MEPIEQVERFKDFIESNYEKILHEIIQKGTKTLILDFSKLAKFDIELAESLLSEPEEIIKAAELALEQFDLPEGILLKVRLTNLPKGQKIFIKDIRSIHLDQLMEVEGLVRQSSDVRPQVTSAKFECPVCGNTITILQLEQRFREPTRCSCGQRGRFRLISKNFVDIQRLIIEECPESLEGGEHPKRISVFLKEDLVEPRMEKRTTPGTKVRIIGVIKEVPIILKTGAQSTRYDLMIDVNNIEPIEETYETIDITSEDEKKIKALSKDPTVYNKLINSIAPSIYGHLKIKEALILQLMGGVKKVRNDGTAVRGDIHVLLVGDPGAAKTSMLMSMSKVAPKARYVAGRGATAAGITAAVVKDEFLKGWALEAGALILANGGLCAIDELDKMSPEDRSAMHEALAQQRVTISKANIQATLRAETTVLAAANPKFGRFDPYKPIADQIDLPPTLINRFDLIFPVRDIPNVELDERIASHLLKIHQNVDSEQPEIENSFLKKYIAYAKQRFKPVLTDEAIEEIKKFYVELRNKEGKGNEAVRSVPISARQIEALVRLAEGSARTRLSNKVIKEDAQRATSILQHCLMAVGFDYETKTFDIDLIGTGVSASSRSKIAIIKEIVEKLSSSKKFIPVEDILFEASEKGLKEDTVREYIDKLKRSGDVFEPKPGFVQKI